MCAGVRRFACFSSTLNCIIVKKADVSCSTIDDPFPWYWRYNCKKRSIAEYAYDLISSLFLIIYSVNQTFYF